MPRGAPDYSNVRAFSPLHRVSDLAELAARLSSPVAYSRSGNVIWLTSFEHGLQGVVLGTDHADSVGGITASRSYHGSFSLYLDPRDATDSYVEYARSLQYIEAGKVGLEIALSLDRYPDKVRLQTHYMDGVTSIVGEVRYDTEGEYWQIKDGDSVWQTVLEDFYLQDGAEAWHNIKLVVDNENEVYGWLLVDKHVVNISEYSLREISYPGWGQFFFKVTAYGDSDRHAKAYVDDIIVTQGEP
jgi:hypothetical protein